MNRFPKVLADLKVWAGRGGVKTRQVMALRLWIFCGVVLFTGSNSGPTIYTCRQGSLDVAEDTEISFRCGSYWNELYWNVYDGTDREIYSGVCDYNTGCTPTQNQFSLRKLGPWVGNGYDAVLSIKGITRFSARRLYCTVSGKTRECKLRITAYPSNREDGSCNISIVDWLVTGSCAVEGMYASDNYYTCSWTAYNTYDYFDYYDNQRFGGFGGTLKDYTASNYRTYRRGVCSFTQPMPVLENVYVFAMAVSPGSGVYYGATIDIAYPAGLIHNCPPEVLEGSNITCTCTAEKSGNPPARITWDRLHNETLQLTDVGRQSQGAQFSCRLTWGPNGHTNKTIWYTLSVAYGPLVVYVDKTSEASADESEIVRLTCKATDVFPSATFSWSVPCHNQTDDMDSSTCVVSLTHIEENLVVTCTAHNKHFANVSSSSTYVLQIAGGTKTRSSDLPASGRLVGGVTAAVVGVILVGVIIVYIKKRRRGTSCKENYFPFSKAARKFFQRNNISSSPQPHVHTPPNQPPIQRQAAASGDLYTIASTTTTGGQVTDDYASVCKMVKNEVYGADSNVRFQPSTSAHEMNRSRKIVRPPKKPKRTKASMKTSMDMSDTVYMNVTEVPTDSGLGVYHIVPRAVTSEGINFIACDTSGPADCEGEYNVLRFDGRSVQDDAGDTYNHL